MTREVVYGKCPACAICMKLDILIDICMLIKSLRDLKSRRTYHLTYRGYVLIKRTFGDLCRSNGESYDFKAMDTFYQHAKIYQYRMPILIKIGKTGNVPPKRDTSRR